IELQYLSAQKLLGDTLVLLQADRVNDDSPELCGEQILRRLLKRRGIALVVHDVNHQGVSEFASTNAVAVKAVRTLYDIVGEEVWLNALNLDDFVVLDE